MRRPARADDDLLETLEPLDPNHPDLATVGHHHRESGREKFEIPSAARPDSKSRRRVGAGIVLAALVVVAVAAAGYVRSVQNDLRDLETVWRGVVAIDADRAAADDALTNTRRTFGDSPALDDKRDTLYDAADARFTRYERKLDAMSVGGRSPRSLRDEMLRAIKSRRSDFRREQVSTVDANLLTGVEETLDRALDRWYLEPRRGPRVRLTAAHELVERLDHMADEPTGLVLGVVSQDGLRVIDVDANTVVHRPLELEPEARVYAIDGGFVVLSNLTATAYSTAELHGEPRWTRQAVVAVSSLDRKTVWLQFDSTVSHVDYSGAVLETQQAPPGAVLAAAIDEGLVFQPPLGSRAFSRARFGPFAIDGSWAAVLDRGNHILIGQPGTDTVSRTPWDVLRVSVPTRVYDLAALNT